MYNIIQLNDKELSELQSIAKELGIKNAESMKKDALVYGILDEQAIANATKKTANKDKEAQQPRKRARVSVKKEGDKVYTATKDKAQKLEANTPDVQKASPFGNEPAAVKEEAPAAAQEAAAQAPAAEEKPAAKTRGRKSKSDKIQNQPVAAPEAAEEAPMTETPAPEAPVMEGVSEFIPIEDLPSEKVELPSELIGKFEATKGEANRFQNRNQKHNNQRKANNNNQYNNQNNNQPAEGEAAYSGDSGSPSAGP